MLGACGTVVAVTAVLADDAEDVPYALDAVTVYVYCVLEERPVTVIGDVPLVNVDGDVEGDGVTTNEFGAPPLVPAENATEADPLLNARPDPEFVATTDVGAEGATAIANHPEDVYCSKIFVSVL